MAFADRSSIRRMGGVLLTALTLCLAGSVQPASAQGLFEALFGGFQRRAPEPSAASQFLSPIRLACSAISGRPAKPAASDTASSIACAPATAAISRCNATPAPPPAELCKSFCPAAKTMVFSGSKIDTAVAQNGTRYADLDNAFAYRDKVSDGCSCNGKDGLGLARVDASGDPTLRPGDIVATDEGLAAYNGKSRTAEFTPINTSSSEWARRLVRGQGRAGAAKREDRAGGE